MRLDASLALLAAVAVLLGGAIPAAAAGRIVLVGGPKSEGPLRHDYPNGVRILESLLRSSPELAAHPVSAYPDGWPADPAAFDGAATIVWYFDGDVRHPLLDAQRREGFAKAMRGGAGVVALHQSSTLPSGDGSMELPRWLGGVRRGMIDRTDAILRLTPAEHPVTRGIARFEHFDESYPALELGAQALPVLRAPTHTVAWVHERDDGGRAFVFTGAHYLLALDAPPVRKLLLNAILWTARREVPADGASFTLPPLARDIARALDAPTFHRDARRSGWNAVETQLTPANVSGGRFGLLWESPPLDAFAGHPPRLYASPLYLDRVVITAGMHRGVHSVVFAASSNGYAYAISAFATAEVPAGTILWRTRLAAPCLLQPAPLDGVPTGVLATPVIDSDRSVLYVTHCDPAERWQAYALDLGSGAVRPGWPVRLDEETFNAPGMNANAGPTVLPSRRRHDFRVQRAALNLTPDGRYLLVAFGESETGWLAAIDTRQARVASAFATQAVPHRGSGGVWGAGGPAVDASGNIFIVTGTGFGGYVDRARDWTQSLLRLTVDEAGLRLRGTYTPFNHCETAAMDIDLGSGGAALLPDSTLLALGGKQGNVYLLDGARLPGGLERRPACGGGPAGDASLLPPQPQPPLGARGPLNVFGPYSESDAAMDLARARSVPAAFRDASGRRFVFVTGDSKRAAGSAESVPPSIARLEVVEPPGHAPYLRLDRRESTLVFRNPGSPVVSSDGERHAIVWVLDENAPRSALLRAPDGPRPVLHALDAETLAPLWRSRAGDLQTSGKYNQPVVARGRVFVGTDRIQAFGLAPATRAVDAGSKPAASPAARAPRDAAALYAERCASCHDASEGSIPPRGFIAARPRERIIEALTRGSMAPHARGLDAAEIEALAAHLHGSTAAEAR